MPFVRWYGIDITGKIQKGLTTTRSVHELTTTLLAQDIVCLRYYFAKPPYTFSLPLSLSVQRNFFKQLATLLDSGVFLDRAVLLLSTQIKHHTFKAVIQDILESIIAGQSFDCALQYHPLFFDSLTHQLVVSGQAAGDLATALHKICLYQDQLLEFSKKIRAALCMPCITLLFFIVVAGVIFIGIVPSLMSILLSTGKQLPHTTLLVMHISHYLNSMRFVYTVAVLLFTIPLTLYIFRRSPLQKYGSWMVCKIPWFGNVVQAVTLATFFQAVALATQSGVPMVSAFQLATIHVRNQYIASLLQQLTQKIEQGAALSQAMMHCSLFATHICSLVEVGEESGCLSDMFEQIASLYREQAQKYLQTIAIIIQPVFMICLGMLMVLLIAAVYIPLLTVSSVIQ